MSRKKTARSGTQTVMGVAWYRADQWSRLRELSLDADELKATYEEWLALASDRVRELQAQGIAARRVDVDVEELLRWCWKKGLPFAGPARAQFAADRVQQLDMAKKHPPAAAKKRN